jgi:hypothetical protein
VLRLAWDAGRSGQEEPGAEEERGFGPRLAGRCGAPGVSAVSAGGRPVRLPGAIGDDRRRVAEPTRVDRGRCVEISTQPTRRVQDYERTIVKMNRVAAASMRVKASRRGGPSSGRGRVARCAPDPVLTVRSRLCPMRAKQSGETREWGFLRGADREAGSSGPMVIGGVEKQLGLPPP